MSAFRKENTLEFFFSCLNQESHSWVPKFFNLYTHEARQGRSTWGEKLHRRSSLPPRRSPKWQTLWSICQNSGLEHWRQGPESCILTTSGDSHTLDWLNTGPKPARLLLLSIVCQWVSTELWNKSHSLCPNFSL